MSNSYWDDINVKVDDACPIATSDIAVNLKNRQKAIDTAGYGPLNPTKPNNEFWDAKAERWNVTADDARGQKCGNCAAFIKTKRMLDCIDEGLGNESGSSAWDVINAGDLGYCEAFDFKCASSRTCDTWIVGGPITEEKENNMEEKSLEDMYLELLAIEEKVAPIVPISPVGRDSRLALSKNVRRRPSDRNMNRYSFGYNKADEEDEPEEDMLYDEDYMGDEEDDKAMMRPMGGGGGAAKNPGSPRAADERQRGRQFMNWASGQSPSGNNVHPTSVGNMDIGDSGRRNLAKNRMNDLTRNRTWTNPSPRPRVRPERGPGNPGPAPRPRYVNAPNNPIPNNSGRKKPKDWGSDNAAQQISGGIPQKSAWDQEAYYDYDFDMKKLPIQGSSPKPYKASGPSADARAGATASRDRAGLAAAGRYFGDPKKGKERIRSFGNTAIGAAGSASGAPMGDNRNGTIRPNRGAGNPGRPAPRPVRGPGKAAPTSFGDYLRGNDLGQSKGRSAAAGRRGAGVRQAAYDIAGSEGPKSRPQKMNRGSSSVDRPQQQMPRAFNQAMPRQDKPSQGSLGKFGKPKTWSGSPGAGGPRQRTNPNIRTFAGKSYDEGYEYDEYDEYIDAKGAAYSSNRRNDLTYGPVEQVGNPGAGVTRRRITGSVGSDAMPGMRFRKGSDAEMYMDDDDEMAIPPDTDDKAAGSPGDAAARQEFQKFGDHLEARDIADGPQRAAESAKRKAGLNRYVSAVGASGLTHNKTPKTPMSPGGMGGPGASKRPGSMSNKPNRPIASGSGTRRTGSADSMARRNTPAKKPSQPNSLQGSLFGRQDRNQTGPKLFGRNLW